MEGRVNEGWRKEKRSAFLYQVLAERERDPRHAELFRRLLQAAEEQAVLWEEEGRRTGVPLPDAYRPDGRTRLVAKLVRRFGPRLLRSVLSAMEVRGMSIYPQGGHGTPLRLEDVGRRHRSTAGLNNLRAAVFGVNDGLVSNASLILGVAGAAPDDSGVLLAGAAGLLAGAFSMAAGEYISVRSQREVFEYQIGLEREELRQYPDAEAAELALIYEAKGMPVEEARALAAKLVADPERALETLAREELGLDPKSLASPTGAALASFGAFAIGAAIPLAPFVLARGSTALVAGIAVTAVALFTVGAVMSLFSGRAAWSGGLRMLAIGLAAGGATYLIGRLLGVALT